MMYDDHFLPVAMILVKTEAPDSLVHGDGGDEFELEVGVGFEGLVDLLEIAAAYTRGVQTRGSESGGYERQLKSARTKILTRGSSGSKSVPAVGVCVGVCLCGG